MYKHVHHSLSCITTVHAGMMSGPKVGLSLAFGALLGFGIIGPVVDSAGLTPGVLSRYWHCCVTAYDCLYMHTGPVSSYGNGVHGWLLWPGVTLMVCDALTNLSFLINWRVIWGKISGLLPKRLTVFLFMSLLSFTHLSRRQGYVVVGQPTDEFDESVLMTPEQRQLVRRYWITGSIAFPVFIALTTFSLWYFFNLAPWHPLVAIAVTGPLAYVAVRYQRVYFYYLFIPRLI